MKTCFDLMLAVNEACCGLLSIEREGRASNSELRRWFLNGAVVINGMRSAATDEWPEKVTSFVLFPKGKRKITLL